MKGTLFAIALSACAPSAVTLTAYHPANPDAPAGRLAGPPAALRPGVAQRTAPTAPEPAPTGTGHEHHEMTPAGPAPASDTNPTGDNPKGTPPKPAPHQGHDMPGMPDMQDHP